jgi:hypothetical protein
VLECAPRSKAKLGQFAAVHYEIRRLDGKVDALNKRIDVSDRLAAIEGRIRELEARN